MLTDKNSIIQIFGSLMKNPLLLAETDKYILSLEDFSNSFEKYIFSAIYNLYQMGAQKISVIDIDSYLENHEVSYEIFKKNNGIEYLNDCEDLSQLDNFKYYYTRLKKINVLRDLQKMGYDTSKIYSEDITDFNTVELNNKFELLEVQDIFNLLKKDVINLEERYNVGNSVNKAAANKGIRELVKRLSEAPEVGARLQGKIFNTIVRGARKGKYFIRSSNSGGGKTRGMVGDACYIAYPIRYNNEREKWEYNGYCEKVCFIVTEQTIEEIQTMILAYLTDINEEKILFGIFTPEEKERLECAFELMDTYKDNLILIQMPDPSIAQIKVMVRQQYLVNSIDNLFYDYIFSSPSLLNEYRDLKVREDIVLGIMSNALKELSTELGIFVMSATQVNAEADNKQGIRDFSCIRGARSIGDKADVGCITMRVTPEESKILERIVGGKIPNQVTDIYKNRRGRFTNVRVWSYADLGTCRKEDLFVTDADYNPIENFFPIEFIFNDEKIGEFNDIINRFNGTERIEAPRELSSELEKKLSQLINDEDWSGLL